MVKILAIVVIVIAAAAVFMAINQGGQPGNSTTSEPSGAPKTTQTPGTIDPNNDLLQGGSSFSDPAGVYTFLYPNDWKIETMNNGQYTRVFMQGPTQTGQTEMFDGVIVHFETVDLGGKTLSAWVDESIKNSTTNGAMEITSPKKPTTLNSYPGFTYALRGLGETTYVAVQKDTNSNNAVVITTLVADPGNLGFQGQVDKILATLQILK